MKVACIIPVYREPIDRVSATVASVLAVSNIDEVVLVDDGCDATELDDLGVTVVHLPNNAGPAAAMNAGVAETDAEIICRLDVGDSFLAVTKAEQIETVLAGTSASFSPFFDLVEQHTHRPPLNWPERIYVDGMFCICTAVFRREVFDVVHGFDEDQRYGDDWVFSFRVQHAIGWTEFPQVTCNAGAFPDGHTKRADVDKSLRQRKAADTARAIAKAHALSHPGFQRLK